MNWDAIGSTGEVLGSVLVMISFVYLAVQIRVSNSHAEASAEVSWMEGWNRVLEGWVSDENALIAVRQGLKDFNGLSGSDKAIFQVRVGAMVNHWVLAGQLRGKKLITEDLYETATAVVVSVLSSPGGRQYWEKDAVATPDGQKLLALVNSESRPLPHFLEQFPWWDGSVT
jgi:hypothetical protein